MATEEVTIKKRAAKAKGALLWRLILNTPGVPDLASHVEKETPFDKLPQSEQVTALVIVSRFEEGARVIDEETAKRTGTGKPEAPASAVAAEAIPVAIDAAPAESGAIVGSAEAYPDEAAPTDAPIVIPAEDPAPAAADKT